MKLRSKFRFIIFIAVAAIAILFCRHSRQPRRAAGPIASDAYIWQRAWTPAVADAVKENGPAFGELVYLAAEVSFRPDFRVVRVSPEFASLRESGRPIAIALRIGPYQGKFDAGDPLTARLCKLAQILINDAKAVGVNVAELQIDFDCAEARLEGYRIWTHAIKQRIAPIPLAITALPSWLKRSEFKSLAREAGGYVLQVHSLERPTGINTPMSLCDPAAARRAVEQAGRLGIPFRVALPTYGYVVAFDTNGKFAGLGAESSSGAARENIRVRELRTDPAPLAELVRGWIQDRPDALKGLIWYRLPTADDALNWRWATLRSVMAGRTPAGQIAATIGRSDPGLFDVALINRGDADAPLPQRITLSWHGAELVAADSLVGFDRREQTDRIVLTHSPILAGQRLAAGDIRAIGWVRLSDDKEIFADVSTIEQ